MVQCLFKNEVVVGWSPVAVTKTSDIALFSRKEFLDIQAKTECRFTVKRVRDIIKTYSQLQRKGKYSQLSAINWSVWPNG